MIKGTPKYQSEQIPVHPTLTTEIESYLKTHNLGKRGVEDGDKHKQLIGLIGELTVIQKLNGKPVKLAERTNDFDGGFDLIYKGYRIDVKTMERNSFVQGEYVNNFYTMQENYEADIIVFCSYNASRKILEICGWIFKPELKTLGIFYKAGTKRDRNDLTSFTFRQDNYEVKNKDLKTISQLISIKPKSGA